MASQEGPLYHLAPLAAWGAAKHANTPYTPATYEQACLCAARAGMRATRPRSRARSARPRRDARVAAAQRGIAAALQAARAGGCAGTGSAPDAPSVCALDRTVSRT